MLIGAYCQHLNILKKDTIQTITFHVDKMYKCGSQYTVFCEKPSLT